MNYVYFPDPDETRKIAATFGTPVYVYDEASLERQADAVLAFPNAYGLTARFAMKALPTAGVLRVLHGKGLHIDASSGYEVARAIKAGIPPGHIQLTAQEMPSDVQDLLDEGVLFTACSLTQLARYGELGPGSDACIRVNPGLGSGHSNRTNVGGPSASFGIWHEHLSEVEALLKQHRLRLTRLHTHIGSGADPVVWERCARMTLAIAAQLPDVTSVSLGGGFKVARVEGETSADLQKIGEAIKQDFVQFQADHGRKLHLEIEPGTFLVANAGALVCTAIDVVDTGNKGYRFIKIDSGMTEILRPSIYGAQHPIVHVALDGAARELREYIVVGHCCESGDVLTPEPGNPEGLLPRELPETRPGDLIVVGGAGAYCAAMASKNYNSFPEAPEVLRTKDGGLELIRRRQTLDQILANEL